MGKSAAPWLALPQTCLTDDRRVWNSTYPGPVGAGGEADLDLEYLMAVSQGTPTSFFYIPGSGGPSVEDPILAFLELAASLAAPPEVLSISCEIIFLFLDQICLPSC